MPLAPAPTTAAIEWLAASLALPGSRRSGSSNRGRYDECATSNSTVRIPAGTSTAYTCVSVSTSNHHAIGIDA
jgi:hypothetical protein